MRFLYLSLLCSYVFLVFGLFQFLISSRFFAFAFVFWWIDLGLACRLVLLLVFSLFHSLIYALYALFLISIQGWGYKVNCFIRVGCALAYILIFLSGIRSTSKWSEI